MRSAGRGSSTLIVPPKRRVTACRNCALVRHPRGRAEDIAEVTCHVHQAAIDVLGPVTDPKTVHQAKVSMGTVLGLIAVHGVANLDAFERYALTDPKVAAFRAKVRMVRDAEIDALYPKRWIGKLTAISTLGRTLEARMDEQKGDPGNTLTAAEIEAKAIRLAGFRNGASAEQMRELIGAIWNFDNGEVDSEVSKLNSHHDANYLGLGDKIEEISLISLHGISRVCIVERSMKKRP
jgi:2-methylcitrate dehydratase PrpD